MKILQLNIRSFTKNKNLLDHFINKNNIDIILLQETWMVGKSKPTLTGYQTFNKNRRDGYGGVAVLVRNNLIAFKYNMLGQLDPLEEISVKLIVNKRELIITSVYIPPKIDTKTTETKFLLLLKNLNNTKFIVGGDVNAQHPIWNNNNKVNDRGKVIADAITNNNCIVINDGSDTHETLSKNTSSAIDITFLSHSLIGSVDWKVSENLGSDHLAIEISMSVKLPTQTRKIINYKKITNIINSSFPEFDSMEDLEKHMTEIVTKNTTEMSTKLKAKYWWNEKIERLWIIKSMKQKIYNKQKTLYTAAEYKKAVNKLRNEIKREKRNKWHEFIQEINPRTDIKTIWTRINQVRKTLEDSHKQNILNTKANKEFFLKSNFKESTVKTSINKTLLDENPKKFTAADKIKELILKTRNSAPGTDQISNQLLKNLDSEFIFQLVNLFNNIWNTQKQPKTWKVIKVIGIPKPGKDHTDIKNYRPISMLPAHLKLFNTIVKDKIDKHISVKNILPNRCFGFRKGKSINDLFFDLLSVAENGRKKKLKQAILTIDLSAAFDQVSRIILVKLLKDLNFEDRICYWIDQFLSNRILKYDDSEIVTSEGLPQGSILSPILFNVYTKNLHKLNTEFIKIFQYADDFTILIQAKTQADLKTEIEKFLVLLNEELRKINLKINFEKCYILNLFSNNTYFSSINFSGRRVEVVKDTKILGITVDNKLNFNKHHEILTQNCQKDINLIKIINGIQRGAHPRNNITLYRSLIKSKLSYSQIPSFFSSTNSKKKIQTIVNTALRTALGLTKNTPNVTTLALAGELPWDLNLELIMKKYIATKIYKDQYIANQIKSERGFEKLATIYKNEDMLQKCPTLDDNYGENKNLKVEVDGKSKKNEEKRNTTLVKLNGYKEQGYSIIYTDGSKKERENSGLGIFFEDSKEVIMNCIREQVSIECVELIAVLMAIKSALVMKKNKICIATDSKSTLESIKTELKYRNGKYYENIIIKLANSLKNISVILIWIPGHMGIKGNIEADKAAKLARQCENVLSVKIPINELKRNFEEKEWDNWNAKYSQETKGQHLKLIFGEKLSKKPWFYNSNLKGGDIKLMNRMYAGHTYDGVFLKLMKKIDTNLCDVCNILDDCEHRLFKCTKHIVLRQKFGIMAVSLIEFLKSKKVENNVLINFIREAGIIL